jgi:hypothetical protein
MPDYDGGMILRHENPTVKKNADGEPELQWLEDGVNHLLHITFDLLARTSVALLTAGFRLYSELRKKDS